MSSEISMRDIRGSRIWSGAGFPWLVCLLAATGLLINIIFFGLESFDGRPFFERISLQLPEYAFILSLVFVFPVIAWAAHRTLARNDADERSRILEKEVEERTRELDELKSFSENIMASVIDVIFVISPDGRFQFVNGDSEAVLGYQPESLIGRQFIDIVAPGTVAVAAGNFEKAMWGHEVQPYELGIVDSNGAIRHVEISGTAYREGDKVVAQVNVARDITERKKLEQHISERNRELAVLNAVASATGQSLDMDQVLGAALDQIVDLFTAHRASAHICNEETRELDLRVCRGGSAELRQRIAHMKPGEGLIGRVAKSGDPATFNIEESSSEAIDVVAADGAASAVAVPMKFRGRLLGVLSVTSESNARFSRSDVSLLLAVANQVATALENALLFKDLQDKTGELASQNDDLAEATARISQLIASAEKERSFSVRFENPALVKCWEVKDCQQVDCPSYESENLRCWQVAGTHCSGEVQGVFAQKLGRCDKCEVYRQGRSSSMAALGEAFNNMMAMLEQQVEEQRQLQEQLLRSTRLAALGELAANVAHEINNPLTGVLGYASLLQRDLPNDDPHFGDLKTIESETIRARDIVRNLLDFARREDLQKHRVSLEELMDDTLMLFHEQAESAGVEVVQDYSRETPQVFADINMMKQVFINILNNALHVMEAGGKLNVSIAAASPEGGCSWVEVAVSDTGPGIPPQKLDLIFSPFYSSREADGAGLGLAISRRIIEEHGGVVEVASQLGAGSTFTVKLPTATVSTGFKRVA